MVVAMRKEDVSLMKVARRFVFCGIAVAALMLFGIPLPQASLAIAQESRTQESRNPAQPPATSAEQHKGDEHKSDEHKGDEKETPVPPEAPVITHHEMSLGGKTLKYTATAGNLLIRDDDDKPYGSMFYVGYTLEGVEPGSRPVSFLYNGGPGAATLWLHMGSFSPVRIQTDSPNATAGPPFKLASE